MRPVLVLVEVALLLIGFTYPLFRMFPFKLINESHEEIQNSQSDLLIIVLLLALEEALLDEVLPNGPSLFIKLAL